MSIFRKLYRGETRFDFIGTRKRWYLASGVILVICVLSFVFRGFNFGVEFAGGSQFQIQAQGTTITTRQTEDAFRTANLPSAGAAQEVGSGNTRQIVVKTKNVSAARPNSRFVVGRQVPGHTDREDQRQDGQLGLGP